MTIASAQLLKKLEPAVRPAAAPHPDPAVRGAFESQGFDELLALVSSGSVRSERAVTVAPDADLTETLEPDQLERLGAAADLAETAGASRAVMLIDGRGIVMDVAPRSVRSELSAATGASLTGIDAAVYVAGDDEEGRPLAASRPPAPGSGLIPPSVAAQIAEARAVPAWMRNAPGASAAPSHQTPPAPGSGEQTG